jgi:hypothetical protein
MSPCTLLPSHKVGAVDAAMKGKILAALAMRFDTTVSAIRPHIPLDQINQFGKLRHTRGNTMFASALVRPQQDMHDATFVQVRTFSPAVSSLPNFVVRSICGQACLPSILET